jgi:hypothetical protein
VLAEVIELHDACDQTVNAEGHQQRETDQDDELGRQRCGCHRAQRDHHDLGGKDEVGADRALDLGSFHGDPIRFLVRYCLNQRLVVLVLLGLVVQELVRELFATLEAQEGAAQYQQRRDRPGDDRADRERSRYEDGLVDE